jgi:hypothetical protein
MMGFRRALSCAGFSISLGFLMVCSGARLLAQNNSEPSKTSPAATAPDVPEANPSRPTVTNPATLPPTGYLQFEQGYLGSLTSPETHSQYGYNQTVKIAVHPRVLFQVEAQPFAASTDYTGAPASNAAGAILFGPQVVLFSPAFKKVGGKVPAEAKKTPVPTIAASYLHSFYAGNTGDIDYGSATNTFILLFSGDVGGFHYDTNYIVNEQDGTAAIPCQNTMNPVCVGLASHNIRRAQYGQTLSVNHQIFFNNLQLSVELYHFTQPLVTNTDNQFPTQRANLVDVLFAPSYTLRPNLVLDAGFSTGITNTSTRWQSFAGFTYLLPHRLWRERK